MWFFTMVVKWIFLHMMHKGDPSIKLTTERTFEIRLAWREKNYENILYWSLSMQAMSYNFTVLYRAALHSLRIIQVNTSVALKLLALCSVWRRPMSCQPQQVFPVTFRCWLEDQHRIVSHPANVNNILVWGLGARDNELFTKLNSSI